MAAINKIALNSPSRQNPSELETAIAGALFDLESNTQDLKASLRPLQFVSAREVSVAPSAQGFWVVGNFGSGRTMDNIRNTGSDSSRARLEIRGKPRRRPKTDPRNMLCGLCGRVFCADPILPLGSATKCIYIGSDRSIFIF